MSVTCKPVTLPLLLGQYHSERTKWRRTSDNGMVCWVVAKSLHQFLLLRTIEGRMWTSRMWRWLRSGSSAAQPKPTYCTYRISSTTCTRQTYIRNIQYYFGFRPFHLQKKIYITPFPGRSNQPCTFLSMFPTTVKILPDIPWFYHPHRIRFCLFIYV